MSSVPIGFVLPSGLEPLTVLFCQIQPSFDQLASFCQVPNYPMSVWLPCSNLSFRSSFGLTLLRPEQVTVTARRGLGKREAGIWAGAQYGRR